MKTYDFHSHVIPEAIIGAMRAEPALFGTQIEARGGKRFLVRGKLRLELAPEFCSADGKLEAMDRRRIDVAVISPGPQIFFYDLPEADGVRAARLVNDGTAALVAARPARLRGMATLPMQHPEAAVAELERAARELDFRAVEIATTAPRGEIADPQYRPLLRRAQELKMTVFAHPNTVGAGAGRLADYYLANLVGNPLETTLMLSHLIFSGALDELPELKLLLAHGGGFAPYQIGRLVHGHKVRPEARAATGSSPKDLLKRLYFDTLTHDPQALRYLIDLVGSEQIVLGSDSPFDMGDEDPAGMLGSVPRLSGGERDNICGRNAMRLLGE
ncbi:MAG TPA: amidohydrolase family protein [Burkholderiales bacterium]